MTPKSKIQNPKSLPYISFELPQGFSKAGQVYRQGQMRLATGEDEWVAQQRIQTAENDPHSILVRLSRVTSFTDYPPLCPEDIGHLFMPDLNYLLGLYNTLNPPECELSLSGEAQAIPGSL